MDGGQSLHKEAGFEPVCEAKQRGPGGPPATLGVDLPNMFPLSC